MSVEQLAARDSIEAADWNEWYGDPARWPPSRYAFLADAAMRLGSVLCYPWFDEYFVAAGTSHIPHPRPGMFAEVPQRSPYRDGSRLTVHDHDLEEVLEKGLHRPEGWTDEEENELKTADDHNHLRFAGRVAVRAVARGIALLASSGKIHTIGRAIDGTGQISLQPSDWEILDPIDRIATCRMTPDLPEGKGVDGTHLVFVDENQLEKRLRAYARENPVAMNDGNITAKEAGLLGAPPVSATKPLELQCEQAMRDYLMSEGATDLQRPALLEAISARIGRKPSEGVFERARSALIKDFPGIVTPGRRRGPQGHDKSRIS